jgi:hypothetical protein
MNGNIVGEEFEEYVFEQIAQRQKDQYSGYTSLRTPQQLQYLNNQNAWVKLASGVSILESEGKDRLKKVLGDDILADQYIGSNLAQKAVLFNGLSETDPAVYKDGKKIPKSSEYNFRAGYSKTGDIWDLTSAYGIGGAEFGQQPMPGIQSVNVKSLNRGSIREANIKMKAYNKSQFAIIELLYLRVGMTMLLEWGNDKFINNKGELQDIENTITEDLWFSATNYTQLKMINTIERYRGYYDGNYDGFFGRVVNFTWTFGADGSYDIDLKLITVGDIIESLQANIPVNPSEVSIIDSELSSSIEDKGAYINLAESSIVNAAQNNKIGKYLFTSISKESLWDSSLSNTPSPEYYSLKANIKNILNKKGRNTGASILDKKVNDKYNYFMSFGELLNIFQNGIIPGIELGDKIDPCLDIENDPFINKICYYPNQTSLDPRICIFKYVFGSLGETNSRHSISGITIPKYLNPLNDYVGSVGDNVVYGKLMNIYLNYDFIAKCLISNTKNGKLTVFKFFQKICDGINKALGGVNNIEPIIKDDKIVTFIDQNPIPGYLESLSEDRTIVDLEVFGYNQEKQSSNFVTDISFKTSITPDLASMITIGTTAGNSTEDGTAIANWNKGLKDRFAPKYVEAKGKVDVEIEAKKDRIKSLVKIFDRKSYWVAFSGKASGDGTISGVDVYNESEYKKKRRGITSGIDSGIMDVRQFVYKKLKEDKYYKKNKDVIPQSELAQEKNNNYGVYLSEAFGGQSGVKIRSLVKGRNNKKEIKVKEVSPIPFNKTKYTLFDSKFIDRAMSSYKFYINSIKKSEYFDEEDPDKKTASNQIGFIPVGFNISLKGIAGIKIYNKLNINNTFLPNEYPKSLKFIVKSVDHKIENNTWSTSLDTLSIPNVKNTIKGDVEKFLKQIAKLQQIQTGIIPEEERGPIASPTNGPGVIFMNGAQLSVPQVLSQMNPDARPSFKPFLEEFVSNYKDYRMDINAIGRSYEKSVSLKKENSDNADPGRSKHNYYAGIDANITPPGENMLKKQGMRYRWINHGFQKLSSKHNITWGGNFSSYEDCIHFAYEFSIDTAVANVIEKYGSLDNMKGDNGKTIKLT